MESKTRDDKSRQSVLTEALQCLERGWSIIPLKERDKTPALPTWTPYQTRRASPDEVKQWFARGRLNLGVVCGAISGIVVLDVDAGKGGYESLAALEQRYGPLPKTPQSRTGGGGKHYFFKHPGGTVKNSVCVVGRGLDEKADGGYVALPNSVHPSGRVYEWEPGHSPEDIPLAELPSWLLVPHDHQEDWTHGQERSESARPEESEKICEGQRNDTLFRLGISMRRRGFSREAIEAALLAENKARCEPLLPEDEVRRIVESVMKYRFDNEEQKTQPKEPLSVALLEYEQLRTADLPQRKCHLAWLPEGGNVMIYGGRGVGKTLTLLGLAASLVTGTPFLAWTTTDPVGVLYIDGEMALDELRQRMTRLISGKQQAPLQFLTSEWVFHKLKRDLVLTSEAVRNEILQILDANQEIRVVILDNISALFTGIDEDRKRDWEPIAAWLLRLRHRGLATVLVHHAGKGGQQRGTSGREDSLDTVIHLNKPAGVDAREGCHFELSFTKCRDVTGEPVAPLDVRLDTIDGRLSWKWNPLEVSKLDEARKLIAEGVNGPTELAEELGITKGYASKLIRKLRTEEAA